MTKVYHSSKSDEWSTPLWLFNCFHEVFEFDLDVSASRDNALCVDWFDIETDGLKQDWSGQTCWMNPPYSQVSKWIEKAANEAACTVALVPSRTDTKWFHNFVINEDHYFIPGRLKFGDSKNSAPFPSMLILFNNSPKADFLSVFELGCKRVGRCQSEKARIGIAAIRRILAKPKDLHWAHRERMIAHYEKQLTVHFETLKRIELGEEEDNPPRKPGTKARYVNNYDRGIYE